VSQAALDALTARFGAAVYRTHSQHGDDTALVDPARNVEVLAFLRDTPGLLFDQLIDITCFDTLGLDDRSLRALGAGSAPGDPTARRFHVVYHLRSMATGKRLRIKAAVDEGPAGENPEIDSVTALWKAAIWGEREAWDMFGVRFRGHPDLRRLLLYEEFIGHPLRKDYPKEQRQPLFRRDFS
jgi:NADH-quinone oxidoreductase subunit C